MSNTSNKRMQSDRQKTTPFVDPLMRGVMHPKGDTMQFVAIDVETANADMSSICQIGIAKFDNGVVVDEWSSLINPKTTLTTSILIFMELRKMMLKTHQFFLK